MTDLTADDFPAFFQAIHGKLPFPWQERLARIVVEGGWPNTLKLPTASGKTAVLDIATFALAVQARRADRTAPRRIALVVDRRIVVDDAHRRAELITASIQQATSGILRQVRDALVALSGDTEQPLSCAMLRGGIYKESRWARSPAQPVLLCSTVDQVGSRLLFRGYGLSNHAWPIHAGLIGNDCLIILDEAHCSEPFRQTLTAVAELRKQTSLTGAPFHAVTMTATPNADDEPFTLDMRDHEWPVLQRRLGTSKTLHRERCGTKDADVAKAVAKHAETLLNNRAFVLVVVNRVATARAVYDAMGKLDVDRLLLTGRSRSVERDGVLAQQRERIMAGRDRTAQVGNAPIVVVATQCIEVGADLDADALISECAPLASLRQRLGRLDRLGDLGHTDAIILCRDDQAKEGAKPDAVYGTALNATWQWLSRHQVDDGGILAMDAAIAAHEPTGCVAALVEAPHLFPAYVDLWAQTGPEPAVSPDPAVFLHGPQQGEPEVAIVWRADLPPELTSTWCDVVAMMPPTVGETLSLPLSVARRWLAGTLKSADLADIPQAERNDAADQEVAKPRPALCWRGPERSEVAHDPAFIRPGDVVVVSTTYGGCDAFGWNPTARDPVSDQADQARRALHRPPIIRLTAGLVGDDISDAMRDIVAWKDGDGWPDDWRARVVSALGTRNDLPSGLLDGGRLRRGTLVEPHPAGAGVVVIASAGWSPETLDFSDDDDASSQASDPLRLDEHLGDVEHWAQHLGRLAGLPPELVSVLKLAGRFHDLGKADPRFQALLRGGNRLGAPHGDLLAKSATMLTGAAAKRARERSGYPAGGRHELLSLALIDAHPDVLAAVPAQHHELVRHLVCSHHGRCRPFAPVVRDDRPVTVQATILGRVWSTRSDTGAEHLGQGVTERFWSLNRQYGPWGLAYLETCLRLADHRASEAAESGKNTP